MPKNKIHPAETADSTQPVILRNYPAALCRERLSDSGDYQFHSVSFKFGDSWASFIIDRGNIQQATRRNGDAIPNHVNILLGEADDVRNVSVSASDGNFDRRPMFNSTIYSAVIADRKDYLRSVAV